MGQKSNFTFPEASSRLSLFDWRCEKDHEQLRYLPISTSGGRYWQFQYRTLSTASGYCHRKTLRLQMKCRLNENRQPAEIQSTQHLHHWRTAVHTGREALSLKQPELCGCTPRQGEYPELPIMLSIVTTAIQQVEDQELTVWFNMVILLHTLLKCRSSVWCGSKTITISPAWCGAGQESSPSVQLWFHGMEHLVSIAAWRITERC